ncbi:MAG TPA: hypothetical protein VK098_05960 [Beutenbergiaceae bacterium]|nr:hypothetical protein [Beutenbergiaceae bacterium]
MVTSLLMYPWAIAAVIAVVVIALLLGWWAKRRPVAREKTMWLANSTYVRTLPSFKNQLRVYNTGIIAGLVLLLGASVATGVLAARPVEKQEYSEELTSRDIVLCLDVSGSMIGYDEEIVERFLELLPSFHGERIALSIWNTTSRTVFPLTNDYDMIARELEEAQYVLSFDLDSFGWSMDYEKYDRLVDFIQGTVLPDDDSASLIGDGLATCALMFDEADPDRSRSIIFATDNDIQGEPIYTLGEAADLVEERDIALFGIHAGESTQEQQDEYREIVLEHGGLFYEASNPDLVDGVLDRINDSQSTTIEASPTVLISDSARGPYGAMMVLAGFYLLLVWRLRS